MNCARGYYGQRRSGMSFIEDDRPKQPPAARPGESLADLSVDELKARIEIYRAEIERLARDIEAKEKHRQAADSFFRR
jgi:uncharacterized small protein (DUF1192 family)